MRVHSLRQPCAIEQHMPNLFADTINNANSDSSNAFVLSSAIDKNSDGGWIDLLRGLCTQSRAFDDKERRTACAQFQGHQCQ